MARNHEKHYGKLNRLILQKEAEKWEEKHPKRPKLEHLHDVDEIKNWLPSIKRDIDFCLKQSQVTCYPERKISELQNQVMKLEREYKSFVRKLKQLDTNCIDIPWTNRPYKRKSNSDSATGKSNQLNATKISTPILENEEKTEEMPEIILNFCENTKDEPLKFHRIQNMDSGHKYSPPIIEDKVSDADIVRDHLDWSAVEKTRDKLMATFQLGIPVTSQNGSTSNTGLNSDSTGQDSAVSDQVLENSFREEGNPIKIQRTKLQLDNCTHSSSKNILGLDYSSSEESSG